MKRIEKRRFENERIWNSYTEYVVGQAIEPVAKMHLGPNLIANVGCETIAIYNAMKYIGRFIPLPQVIYEIEKNHMTWFHLGGCFGVNPRKIKKFFDLRRIKYEFWRKRTFFIEQAIRSRDICIVGYRVRKSLFRVHTIALRYDGEGWIIYNLYNQATCAKYIKNFDDIANKFQFIIGYIIPKQ